MPPRACREEPCKALILAMKAFAIAGFHPPPSTLPPPSKQPFFHLKWNGIKVKTPALQWLYVTAANIPEAATQSQLLVSCHSAFPF